MVDSDRNSTELYGDHFAADGCGVGVGEPQMRIDGTRYLGNYILKLQAMEWYPGKFFNDAPPETPYAVLLLNQPLNVRAYEKVVLHGTQSRLSWKNY